MYVGDVYKRQFLDFIGKFLGSQYVWITTISVIVATFCHKQVEKMHGCLLYTSGSHHP